MNRDQLEDAIATKRFEYYRGIAKLILDNPDLSLEKLRKKYGFSYWAVDRVRRPIQPEAQAGGRIIGLHET